MRLLKRRAGITERALRKDAEEVDRKMERAEDRDEGAFG